MKENGRMIKNTDQVFKDLQMDLYIMDIMLTINLKVEEGLLMHKDKYIKVSGKMVLNKAKGFWQGIKG